MNNWGGFCFVIHHDARFQECEQDYKTEDGMKQRETIESISRICFFKKDGLGIKNKTDDQEDEGFGSR